MKRKPVIFLLTLLFCLGNCNAQDIENMSLTDLRKLMEDRRPMIAELIKNGDVLEDMEGGILMIIPGASPSASATVGTVNQARKRWFRQKEEAGSDLEEYIPKYIEHFWKPEGPPAAPSGDVVLQISSSEQVAEHLLGPAIRAFLSREGVDPRAITVATSSESVDVQFRRTGERISEVIKIVFRTVEEALSDLSEGRSHLVVLDRSLTENECESLGDSVDLALPSFTSRIAAEGYVLIEFGPQAHGGGQIGIESLKESLRSPDLPVRISSEHHASQFSSMVFGNPSAGDLVVQSFPEMLESYPGVRSGYYVLSFREFCELKSRFPDASPMSISVEGQGAVEPNSVSLRTGEYPLFRPVLMCNGSNFDGLAKQLRRFLTSPRGQEIVRESGFVGQGKLDDAEQNLMDTHQKSFLDVPGYREVVGDAKLQSFMIRFNSGGADVNIYSSLNAEVRDHIIRLIERISELSANGKSAKVILVGHTDSKGDADVNKELGKKRCEVVADELASMGIEVAEITSENSFGESFPVASNDAETGRGLNRRVEIWLQVK